MIESNLNKDLEYQIDLYINGRLNQEEADELWSELIQNEYYLDYTKSAANIKFLIEQKRGISGKPERSKVRNLVRYAAAAAVAITIGVLGVLNYSTDSGLPGVEPLSALDLGSVRGVDDGAAMSRSDETVRKAVQLANEGQVQDAVDLLETEIGQMNDPQTEASLILTLGSIFYNAGDYETSVNQFRKVQQLVPSNNLMVEKALWYQGNALMQLGLLEDASAVFSEAYSLDGAYSRVLKSYLDAIESSR